MKALQNNFTTSEQSKRLLELGVPANSADCYLIHNEVTNKYDDVIVINNQDDFNFIGENSIPCWSVGRLMEICKICEPKKDYEQLCEELQYCQNYCVLIISHIIANLQIIDFSKLEE